MPMRLSPLTPVLIGLLGATLLWGCQPQARPVQIDATEAYLDARTTLRQAAEDANAPTRAAALEALAVTQGRQAGPLYVQALRDGGPAVRFAAALAVGKVGYRPAIPILRQLAEVERQAQPGADKRVYPAIIYALHRMGVTEYTSDLARLLYHREPEVRANAALVLGELSEPSAVDLLDPAESAETDLRARINMVEALAKLGDQRRARLLEAYTKGYEVEVRLIAIPALGRSGTNYAISILEELVFSGREPPRVRVAAARELAELDVTAGDGVPYGFDYVLAAAEQPEQVARSWTHRFSRQNSQEAPSPNISNLEVLSLQQLAAMALGKMHQRRAVPALEDLLASPHGRVRVAAAMAILEILSESPPAEKTATPPSAGTEARDAEPLEAVDERPVQPRARPEPNPTGRPKLHTSGGKD